MPGGKKKKSATDPQILLLRQLLNTWALVRRVMEPRFSSSGLSSAQWGVIRILALAEEQGRRELMPSELSKQLIVRPPSITGVLDRLKRQGLISRRPSPQDGRVKFVQLTPAGRKLVTEARHQTTPHIKQLFDPLGKVEQEQFSAMLDKLNAHLQHLAESDQASPQ